MDNLHRALAPISAAAWDDLEQEVRRTFTARVAARRVVDVPDAGGIGLSAVGTGHLEPLDLPGAGVQAHRHLVRPLIRLRVPFTVSRRDVDDVERGAQDADWQPAKDAAEALATAEDRMVFDGAAAAGVEGIRPAAVNPRVPLPADITELPTAVAHALTELRLAGVEGPYALLLSADVYTAATESSDHGYPISGHLERIVGADGVVFAPALEGALVVSLRGGDHTLRLGQDVSVGYLSHDDDTVTLYLQESLTFLVHTAEASVVIA